jgi:hypothetical protein
LLRDELPNLSCWALPTELLVPASSGTIVDLSTYFVTVGCYRPSVDGLVVTPLFSYHDLAILIVARLLFCCCDDALHTLCASTALASFIVVSLRPMLPAAIDAASALVLFVCFAGCLRKHLFPRCTDPGTFTGLQHLLGRS